MKVSIVIPCYNEEAGIDNLYRNLIPVIRDLEVRYDLEIIFIDDGSTDNTNRLLHEKFGQEKYVKIIKHSQNMNIGEAIRTGFSHATGDVIITMDSDCTYDPQTIPELLNLLDENTDVVTASPYHPLGGIRNVPKHRLLLSRSITQIYRWLTGSNIYTFTALFRAHKQKVIRDITFKSNDFLATAEILIVALNKGYVVKEYPTILSVRAFGDSKIKLMKVIGSHFKFASRLLFLKVFKSNK